MPNNSETIKYTPIFSDNEKISDPKQLSPLVLAYIGDSVYEVFVRQRLLIKAPSTPPHRLHVMSVRHVKAHAQSNAMAALEPLLTEDELYIYKRGRNAKSATVPKNADLTDYRRATGFEALIGFLYLRGEYARSEQLMETAFENSFDAPPHSAAD